MQRFILFYSFLFFLTIIYFSHSYRSQLNKTDDFVKTTGLQSHDHRGTQHAHERAELPSDSKWYLVPACDELLVSEALFSERHDHH